MMQWVGKWVEFYVMCKKFITYLVLPCQVVVTGVCG